jgi:1,4-alpha-glucan branching enzyme
VSRPESEGGLGFDFKWNMGWMHDTLRFASRDPVHRGWHLGELAFSMVYEHSERFWNPLSHDEVVHGKRSLLAKLPGDAWQKFATLRLLFAYQYTRPGKPLLFMGSELAPEGEWHHERSLDWHLAEDPARRGLARFLAELARVYRATPALWRRDPDPDGFEWIDWSDHENAVVAYLRRDGERHALVVLNWTPVPRERYRLGVPGEGAYELLLSSDEARFGGSGAFGQRSMASEPSPWHGRTRSILIGLPPLAALVLAPADRGGAPR